MFGERARANDDDDDDDDNNSAIHKPPSQIRLNGIK
jgi:hypothetical protein